MAKKKKLGNPFGQTGSIPAMETVTTHQEQKFWEAARVAKERATEALNLLEPFPKQQAIMTDPARILLAVGGNRSSKTHTIAARFAKIVTGRDLDRFPKEDGRAYVVGKDETHLGQTLFRKLFKPGTFKIIKDEVTGEWRTYRRWQDEHRKKEAKPAPPLIPARFIKQNGISWRKKKDSIPKMVKLVNGWEISFFTGEGLPAQGFDVDLGWFDEEIGNSEWLSEMLRGLVDREGTFFWSCTPQSSTEQLLNLSEMADNDEFGVMDISKYRLDTRDNPHLNPKEIARWSMGMSDEERRIRIEGHFATATFLMYPEYSADSHGMDRTELPNGQVPHDWTRYVAIDPGYGVTAAIFGAIPPPSSPFGDIVLIYDELYIPNCTVDMLAKALSNRMEGQAIEAFVVDEQHAQKTDASGFTIRYQLESAMAMYGVRSESAGCSLVPGFSDVEDGCSLVRRNLVMREGGKKSRLRLLRGATPMLDKCLTKLRRDRTKGTSGVWFYKDVPAPRQDDHTFDCVRYLLGHDPRWVEPRKQTPPKPWAVIRFEAKQARLRRGSSPTVVLGPRSSAG